jgi:hypothetical protein
MRLVDVGKCHLNRLIRDYVSDVAIETLLRVVQLCEYDRL